MADGEFRNFKRKPVISFPSLNLRVSSPLPPPPSGPLPLYIDSCLTCLQCVGLQAGTTEITMHGTARYTTHSCRDCRCPARARSGLQRSLLKYTLTTTPKLCHTDTPSLDPACLPLDYLISCYLWRHHPSVQQILRLLWTLLMYLRGYKNSYYNASKYTQCCCVDSSLSVQKKNLKQTFIISKTFHPTYANLISLFLFLFLLISSI